MKSVSGSIGYLVQPFGSLISSVIFLNSYLLVAASFVDIFDALRRKWGKKQQYIFPQRHLTRFTVGAQVTTSFSLLLETGWF